MKTPDTLVEDIYRVLNTAHEPSEENLEFVANAIKNTLRDRLSRDQVGTKAILRLSNIGSPCQTELWYKVNEGVALSNTEPALQMKFLIGALLEDILLFLVKEAGHTVTRQQEEVKLNGIKGHIDCFIDDVLTDVKSASATAFRKMASGDIIQANSFGIVDQLQAYQQALGEPKAQFLAINKESGEIVVVEVPRDPIDRAKAIPELKEMLNRPTPPEPQMLPVPDGKSGNMKLPNNCVFCSKLRTCWPDVRGFKYASGIRYLTKVVKEPNVEEEF